MMLHRCISRAVRRHDGSASCSNATQRHPLGTLPTTVVFPGRTIDSMHYSGRRWSSIPASCFPHCTFGALPPPDDVVVPWLRLHEF
uniref:Uncharacterized protein n=1 Tax=Trichuris muris TaxID=70415 RepID=A0A5S6Q6V6_TRIMR